MIHTPNADDVFPRDFVFNSTPTQISQAIIPWLLLNRRFTLLCIMRLVGMRLPQDAVRHKHLTLKVQEALSLLRCRPEGLIAETQERIWRYDEVVGGSVVCLQVEVSRAWLQEHARPTRNIRKVFSSDSYRRLVTAWTRETGSYAWKEQENVRTGEHYFAPEVYVSSDAFLVAALQEGYHVEKGWLNLAHRATGAAWKGALPLPWQEPPASGGEVARWLKRQRKGKLWKLSSAPQVPHLAKMLRQLGCSHRVMMVKGVQGSFWYKLSEAPPYWNQPPPRKSRRTQVAGPLTLRKAVITVREAADSLGLTPPRGRAPAALLQVMTEAGYVKKGRRWVHPGPAAGVCSSR